MQRLSNRLKRLLCLLICLFVAGVPFLSCAAEETVHYIAPTLPSDAEPYNPETPELLDENQLYAKSAILIEASTGEVIFEKNADDPMYPASTTKILTALLALMMGDLNDTATVSNYAVESVPSGYVKAKLQPGEEINLRDLLFVTMVMSANDGANVVAEHISGSIPAFADLMNNTARVLGCTNTHFTNPSGIHDPYHYTTARDMAIIAREAMNDSTFRTLCSTTSYTVPRTNMSRARTITSNNYFINQATEGERGANFYPLGNGIKTGNTLAAGYCYVGSASKDGVNLISVVFYSGDNARFSDTQKMMEYGFSQYTAVDPVILYQMNPITVETSGFSLEDSNLGRLQLNIKPKDPAADATIICTKEQAEAMSRQLRQLVLIDYTREFTCPIAYGEEMGTLTYFTDDGEAIEYSLTAGRSIEKRLDAPKTLEEIIEYTYADPNPFPPIDAEFVIMCLSPFIALFMVWRILKRINRRRHIRGRQVPKPQNRYFR